MKKLLYLAIALIFISCNKNEITKNKSTITGNTFDVLLVMTDNDYQSNGGQDLYELLNSEIAGLPQSEPHFKIIRIRTEGFSNLYANYRNMVWVELGDKYALEKLSFINNPYAIGQKMIKITAPNQEGLTNIVKQKGQQIIDYFYTAERNRTITHFRKYKNEKAERLVQKQFGLTILDNPKLELLINKYQVKSITCLESNPITLLISNLRQIKLSLSILIHISLLHIHDYFHRIKFSKSVIIL